MNSVSPVFTEAEIEAERVVALGHPEYLPIIALRVIYSDRDGSPSGNGTVTRFRFSDNERELIANGADLLITQPHHGSLMPIALQLAMKDSYPLPES